LLSIKRLKFEETVCLLDNENFSDLRKNAMQLIGMGQEGFQYLKGGIVFGKLS